MRRRPFANLSQERRGAPPVKMKHRRRVRATARANDFGKDTRMEPTPERNGVSKWYPTLAVALLLLAGFVADRMGAPTWVNLVLIAAAIVLLPFVIRAVIRELRGGGQS